MTSRIAPLDAKLIRDLKRMRGQALAIMFVIGAGIALLVMSRGMLISLDETMRAYYERYRVADIYAGLTRAPREMLARLEAIEGVETAEGRIMAGGLVDLPGIPAPLAATLVSTPAGGAPEINRLHLVSGRMPEPGRTAEALLLRPFAEAHGVKPGDTLRITVKGRLQTFAIVGVALSPEFIYVIPPGEFATDPGRFAVIWTQEDALEAALDMKGAFNSAVFVLGRNADARAVIAEADRLLAPYGARGAIDRADHLSNRYLVEELAQLATMERTLTPIFLGVAMFLLNVVMMRLVQTEREQIGVLKAFGWSDAAVGWHYLKFALAIGVAGALGGWLAGVWLGKVIAEIYQRYFHFPFLMYSPEYRTLAIAIGLSALAAGAGALFAVRAATRLSPAEAMRPAAPPTYRPNALMDALAARFDQPSRMILRRIARFPARTAISVFGVGAAMSLSVMMRSNLDSVNHMVEVAFNVIDRSDIAVAFAEPQGPDALAALRRIPGVELVEPVRDAPVAFKVGRVTRLGSVTALSPEPALYRALDADLRPVETPDGGLVVSHGLAKILKVNVGDPIRVEFREGRRTIIELPVIGVVEALIGTPAYMSMDELGRRLLEPGRASGAYLKTRPQDREAVYAALKDAPAVAGVSLRREAYENFSRMLDEGPGTFRRIMSVISVLIAVGVVYNSARIAYIERARDLASLRILGFRKLETAYVLLGEILVIVILALPVGAVLGRMLWTYLARALSTDLYTIPVVHYAAGLGHAAIIVVGSAFIAGLLVLRDVNRMDLVASMKVKE